MAKPTVKSTKPAPATKAPESTKPMATDTKALSYVNPKAMSIDVGEKAIKAFKATKDIDQQISDLTQQNQTQKGQTLAMLTEAFFKAATEDKNIKLGNINHDVAADLKDLRQRLEVAIGIKVAARGEDGVEKIVYAPWAKDYFPQPGEGKETDGWQVKENFRTNFATAFTKCIKAAHAVQLKGLTMTKDKATGTLLISGKAIKERFNVDQIALNEKREVKDGDKVVKLAKIPSYTELARISAESAGKTLQTRVDSRAKEVNALNETDVVSAVSSLTVTIGKLGNFGDELATALEALAEACEKALQANEGVESAA
jgi:hypothetical protein